jgi:hypothetical protein
MHEPDRLPIAGKRNDHYAATIVTSLQFRHNADHCATLDFPTADRLLPPAPKSYSHHLFAGKILSSRAHSEFRRLESNLK